MLSTIIFSKNRPLQLDLCLTSAKKNWLNNDFVILYTCDPEYNEAYDILKNEHNDCTFVRQDSFSMSLSTCFKLRQNAKYIGFLTDDNIVFEKCFTKLDQLDEVFVSQEIACLSLRLGVNIIERDGRAEPLPKFSKFGNHLIWNRMCYLAQSYWNYPLSVDGHIFRSSFIKWMWESYLLYENISGPNRLEVLMQRFFFDIGQFQICENHSKVVNSPNNRVQEEVKNWYGDSYYYNAKDLLSLYMKGNRIQLENLDFKIKCPHQEVKLIDV